MVVIALFLSVLTLVLAWFNVDLWRRQPPVGTPVLLGLGSGSAPRSRDGLDPLRAVALMGLVAALGMTFHVWGDKVLNYSDQRIGEITESAAAVLSERDPTTGSIERSDVEAALAVDADLDKLRVLEAVSQDGDTTLWQVSDDDGASPRCLEVIAPGSDDADPEWVAIVTADLC